jgi:hypothetical protein
VIGAGPSLEAAAVDEDGTSVSLRLPPPLPLLPLPPPPPPPLVLVLVLLLLTGLLAPTLAEIRHSERRFLSRSSCSTLACSSETCAARHGRRGGVEWSGAGQTVASLAEKSVVEARRSEAAHVLSSSSADDAVGSVG